jgi:hypothetical protein
MHCTAARQGGDGSGARRRRSRGGRRRRVACSGGCRRSRRGGGDSGTPEGAGGLACDVRGRAWPSQTERGGRGRPRAGGAGCRVRDAEARGAASAVARYLVAAPRLARARRRPARVRHPGRSSGRDAVPGSRRPRRRDARSTRPRDRRAPRSPPAPRRRAGRVRGTVPRPPRCGRGPRRGRRGGPVGGARGREHPPARGLPPAPRGRGGWRARVPLRRDSRPGRRSPALRPGPLAARGGAHAPASGAGVRLRPGARMVALRRVDRPARRRCGARAAPGARGWRRPAGSARAA